MFANPFKTEPTIESRRAELARLEAKIAEVALSLSASGPAMRAAEERAVEAVAAGDGEASAAALDELEAHRRKRGELEGFRTLLNRRAEACRAQIHAVERAGCVERLTHAAQACAEVNAKAVETLRLAYGELSVACSQVEASYAEAKALSKVLRELGASVELRLDGALSALEEAGRDVSRVAHATGARAMGVHGIQFTPMVFGDEVERLRNEGLTFLGRTPIPARRQATPEATPAPQVLAVAEAQDSPN